MSSSSLQFLNSSSSEPISSTYIALASSSSNSKNPCDQWQLSTKLSDLPVELRPLLLYSLCTRYLVEASSKDRGLNKLNSNVVNSLRDHDLTNAFNDPSICDMTIGEFLVGPHDNLVDPENSIENYCEILGENWNMMPADEVIINLEKEWQQQQVNKQEAKVILVPMDDGKCQNAQDTKFGGETIVYLRWLASVMLVKHTKELLQIIWSCYHHNSASSSSPSLTSGTKNGDETKKVSGNTENFTTSTCSSTKTKRPDVPWNHFDSLSKIPVHLHQYVAEGFFGPNGVSDGVVWDCLKHSNPDGAKLLLEQKWTELLKSKNAKFWHWLKLV